MGGPDKTSDKSGEWDERHPNPSGIPDLKPFIDKVDNVRTVINKKPQAILIEHHEEGHTSK